MTNSEIIMVFAVLVAPILAVQVQKILDIKRQRNERRLFLFHTLMATRQSKVSPDHVQALNRIDLEFYGRKILGFRYLTAKEKAVNESWRIYLDHLNTTVSSENVSAWDSKREDLFIKLLISMAICLGYDFDEVLLRRGCYTPVAHGNIEAENHILREGLLKLLTGTEPIKVTLLNSEDSDKKIVDNKPSKKE
ncbi:MAG: DUF6680 family protein [Pusillimonas sp.]